MRITMRDPFTGQFHTEDLPMTVAELSQWKAGGLIQNVCPHLSLDQREFLISGVPIGKWDEYMGEER